MRLLHKGLWLSGIAILCMIYGFIFEPITMKTRKISYSLNGWEGPGLRIVFLADIHIAGEHVSPPRVEKIAELIKAAEPDLILIGGDFIDGHVPRSKMPPNFNRKVGKGLKILGRLSDEFDVVSVIGNHDVWYDKAYVKNMLTQAGVVVLDNSGYRLGNTLCIVGIADDLTEVPSDKGFESCAVGDDIIALMHSPDSFELLRPETDLALAGHTHGGQINLPLLGRSITSTRAGKDFAYGQVEYKGIAGFVTAGIGTSILPARFRSPPEIVVVEID